MPSGDLEATCLEKGSKVYTVTDETDVLYVLSGEKYQKFVINTPE